MKNVTLFLSAQGHIFATSRKELVEKAGGGRVSKMYRDGTDGKTYHVGYVVGPRWFVAYAPVKVPVDA